MEILIAQAEAASIKPWLDLAVSYGIPLLITILVIILMVRYVPRFIEGSLEAQRTVPVAINGLTEAMDKTRETLKEGVDLIRDVKEDSAAARDDLDQLKRAVGHGAAASEKLLLEAGRKRDSDVIIELGKMKQAVHDVGRRRKSRRPDDSEEMP